VGGTLKVFLVQRINEEYEEKNEKGFFLKEFSILPVKNL